MVVTTVLYQGEKHCEITHGPSQAKISTDAPLDNNGKGELFSPTDLVGAALGSCILTVMAIVAERENIDLRGMTCVVEKEMQTSPRRIAKLVSRVTMPRGVEKKFRAKLEATALHCPVHKSLHPEIESPIVFDYPD